MKVSSIVNTTVNTAVYAFLSISGRPPPKKNNNNRHYNRHHRGQRTAAHAAATFNAIICGTVGKSITPASAQQPIQEQVQRLVS